MTPREYRIAEGLSIKEMAEYCDTRAETWAKWERGLVPSRSEPFVRLQIKHAASLFKIIRRFEDAKDI